MRAQEAWIERISRFALLMRDMVWEFVCLFVSLLQMWQTFQSESFDLVYF